MGKKDNQEKKRQEKEGEKIEEIDLGDIGGTITDSDTLDRLEETTNNLENTDNKYK